MKVFSPKPFTRTTNAVVNRKLTNVIVKAEAKTTSFSKATVLENVPVSADGNCRRISISIEDEVKLLSGRQFDQRKASRRWIDAFTMPGQCVAIRYPGPNAWDEGILIPAKRPYAITSSPMEAKQKSANLDASIVEILAERGQGDKDDDALAAMEPMSQLEVSAVVGRGFGSLLNPQSGLLAALEESRPIVAIAVGSRGMSALRPVLEFDAVQALAGSRRVTAYCISRSPVAAPYLADWDRWRDAGIRVNPLYTQDYKYDEGEAGGASGHIQRMVFTAIFGGEQGLVGAVGGDPADAAFLMSGVPGEVAAAVARRLTGAGVSREHIMFPDS